MSEHRLAADQNLLFGVLALQMGFITSAQLVAATHAWACAKARPLGEILVSHNALSVERRALLESLVSEHLRQHGDDVHRSLAAVAAIGTVVGAELESVTSALKSTADADVQASISDLAATVAGAADPYRTRIVAPAAGDNRMLRFRILRPHARGGLGEVLVAYDQELSREVAVKEILGQFAGDVDSRTRFMLEAEVTGGLEHPGIVPVYGLGQYADGRPYYAMRFIRGQSLMDALERFHKADGPRRDPGERTLEFRSLLGSFVAVCQAIAYAHSRRVLHRDLKPANIMLGKYGETLVVDWGLAKTLGHSGRPTAGGGEGTLLPPSASDSQATLMGSAVGTPAFMAPEQADGRLDLLGPATDIYSLGATLYCLLTGVPPFGGSDVGAILQQVLRGDFVPPRQQNAAVPAALEAVCLKAMALLPEQRYASAAALADDVEHWLADEPVSVYREPLPARLTRWGRRHRTLLAASAGLLSAAVVALTLSTVLIWREQARTEEQRRQADAHFQTALAAVNDMLTEVAQEQLALEPRMEKKRLALLRQARSYYVSFLAQKSDDPALREATAQAQRRLGDIARLLGKYDDARAAYRAADALFEKLLEQRGADPELRRQRLESLTYLGEVQRLTSQTHAAAAAYQQAQELARTLVAQHPDRPLYRQELARTYYNLGILWKDTGRAREAEQALTQAIEHLQALTRDYPGVPEHAQHLARGYLNLGPVPRAGSAGAKRFS